MTETLVNTLRALGEDVVVIDKGFSVKLEDVGRFTWRKLAKLPRNLLQGLGVVGTRSPEMCIFFLTCSRFSLVADALMIAALRSFGCPVILYLHGRGYRELARQSRTNHRLLQWIFGEASHVVTLTPSLHDDISALVDKARVSSVPNAIPTLPPPNRNNARDRVTALFLSNFERAKGALDVVAAAHRLVHLRDRMRVVLAGGVNDPAFHDEVRKAIEARGMQDFVELRGPVYGDDKLRLLADSDIFLFPTYYPFETFGLVNLEAMRAGLAVISTRVGGIPDVVVDGVTGYLIDPRDEAALARHLQQLVEDSRLRTTLGEQGRRRFETHYTLAQFTLNWKRALEDVRVRLGAR
jgi:glycosyltransferase involved in cell wall biosynthesis